MKAWHGLLMGLLLVSACVVSSLAQDNNTADLRRRADAAKGKECAHLCMQAAQQALEDANRHFVSGDVKAARTEVDISLHYVQRSVDCSLQLHKSEKGMEIELRKLIRRTKDVMQTLDSENRPYLAQSLNELEKQRDRLLHGIFGAAAGGAPESKP